MTGNSRHEARFVALAFVFVLVIGGWAFAAGPSNPGVWIDAPLDGRTVDPGPVTIIGHVTDTDGLRATRLDVDGATVSERAVDVGPGHLVTVTHTWEATTPGTHVVALWGGRLDGSWSGPAAVSVFVTGEVVTTTTTATTTTTTTTVPCSVTDPYGLSPSGTTYTSSSATLQWAYTGCTPVEFEIEIYDGASFLGGTVVGGTSWNVTLPTCGSQYTWWVRAVPSVGSPSGWTTAVFTYTPLGGC